MTSPAKLGLPSKFSDYRIVDSTTGTNQFDIALKIAESNKRFTILSSPTGSGKTLKNIAAAKLMAGNAQYDNPNSNKPFRTLYLVYTNPLLDQVVKDFSSIGLAPIKGRRNYKCVAPDVSAWSFTSCADGKCTIGSSCELRLGGCLYFDAQRDAFNSEFDASNFAYWGSINRYLQDSNPDPIGDFDLIILDEAHSLLTWMSDFMTIGLTSDRVSKVGIRSLPNFKQDLVGWSKWASDNLRAVQRAVAKISRMPAGTAKARELRIATSLGRDLRTLSSISSESNPNWVVERDNYNDSTQFIPIDPRNYLEQYIYRNAPRIILSSASLAESDYTNFDIEDNDYQFIEGGEGFRASHRPVYAIPNVKVSYNMPRARRMTWILIIDNLITPRLEWRGIIHSVSYKRAEEIGVLSQHSRYMIIHNRKEKIGDLIARFIAAPPPIILVSPIIDQGYDLDIADWQIISKVHFPHPNSPLTNARKKLYKEMKRDYMVETAAKWVLQAAGRICRSHESFGETLIVDDAWLNYVRRSPCLPKSFTKVCKVARNRLPKPIGEILDVNP